MRVRCIKIIDSGARPPREILNHQAITVGRDYVVTSIGIYAAHGRVWIQVLDDDQAPSFWDVSMFEVASPVIPSNWHVTIQSGQLELSPEDWTRPRFWEDYFDGDTKAQASFRKELDLILSES